ncbi:MAG TPA: sialate O-acetylesterase [Sphingobacterium sp.]|nr:sialate O-acetylesterase [Sphingobacterium sp.]
MKYFLWIFLLGVWFDGQAKIQLPAILGNNMVLQRNAEVNIWGKASVGEKVKIETSWNDKVYRTHADMEGDWKIAIETSDAGGPYTVIISGENKIVLEDILLGEVWVSSGQSNMEMPMTGFMGQPVEEGLETTTRAQLFPNIRMFTVGRQSTPDPQSNCDGEWQRSTAETVGAFSAVAYFYAKELNIALDVPVGIITTNWGASTIEAWTPVSTLKAIDNIDIDLALAGKERNNKAGYLYNGMISPITNFTAKGFIWYQGEANLYNNNYKDYHKLLAAMIKQWRADWGKDDMYFLYVQLAPYKYDGVDKITLPLIIENQYKTLEMVSKAGIVATNDLGDKERIHPAKKKQVGSRLAYLALHKVYGLKGYPVSPTVKDILYNGEKVRLTFNYADHDMNSFDYYAGEILGFEIAGRDQKFYKAIAKHIRWKNEIELSCPEVKEPIAVRYAFRNFIDNTVRTISGLPLVPFRTDNWDDIH